MNDRVVRQMPTFKRAYKKLHGLQKARVNDAIRALVCDPHLGQEKKGDLAGVFVYKFKSGRQEFLLAYEWNKKECLLLALGVHENFYRDLKKRR